MLSTFFTATKAFEEFNHDYLKGYVMKMKLCPNEADEKTESDNNNSFDSNDGESDTSENRVVASAGAGGAQALPVYGRAVTPISTRWGTFSPPSTASPPVFSDIATALENCRCRRYCNCLVDELESLENESDEGAVSSSEGRREIENSSAIEVDLDRDFF